MDCAGTCLTDKSMDCYILAINVVLRERSISDTECRQWLIPTRSLADDLSHYDSADEGERGEERVILTSELLSAEW